jgi:hypothetical protein
VLGDEVSHRAARTKDDDALALGVVLDNARA